MVRSTVATSVGRSIAVGRERRSRRRRIGICFEVFCLVPWKTKLSRWVAEGGGREGRGVGEKGREGRGGVVGLAWPAEK